jgi:hypothetical protein
MTEYIDREKFLKKIEHFSLNNGTTLGKHSGIADEIIDILEAEPTADVVPRSEVEEAKQEVAREIFDLIKLYKQKWASGEVVPYRFIAELKKKYIGE